MAKSLKTNGVQEVAALRARVRRQHAFGRISRPDAENLTHKLDELEAAIIRMKETNEHGEEE